MKAARNDMKRICAMFFGVGLVMAMAGCMDPFSYGIRGGGDTVPDVVTYEGDVYPILLSYCSSCHSEGGTASSTNLVLSSDAQADFAMIGSFVTAGDLENSPLLQKASGATAHGGSDLLAETSVEYQTLAAWVEQGAAQQ